MIGLDDRLAAEPTAFESLVASYIQEDNCISCK